MTDCGGLLNRRSPGRKRCCHTGLFTRDIRFTFHTDCRGGHGLFTRMVLVPNLRIVELVFFTRSIAESHGLFTRVFFLSRIIEFANWFIFTRSIAESHGVLSRDLSFGPTDQRELICELSNFSSHGASRKVTGFCHELSNYRISFHTESHGESRDLCHELSNCRISFHTESHGGFLCHKTCSWSRICETCPWTH